MSGSTFPRSDPRLEALVSSRGLEDGTRAYLEELRWPDGVTCPRCRSDRIGYLDERRKHYCRDCALQFRVTAGTVLHDSHVPAAKWLTAVGLILDSSRGFPGTQLQAVLGGSYKTAWFVEHRIRAAMAQSLDAPEPAAFLGRATDEPPSLENHLDGTEPLEPAPAAVSAGLRLIKRLASGDYHRASTEHLSAYWAELRWRTEYANDPDAFRKTVQALLQTSPVPYETLVSRTKTARHA